MTKKKDKSCLAKKREPSFSASAAALTPVQPTLIKQVPMRDGVRLYTEIFLPPEAIMIDADDASTNRISKKAKNSLPVVLIRSPYPYSCPSYNDKRPISRYLTAGYAMVFQLTRGQGGSEGTYRYLKNESSDGYDCIEWIARQHWCNSNIGMEGVSYLGSTQLLAAKARPPALKCIMPTAFVGNVIKDYPYWQGVPTRRGLLQWHKIVDASKLDDLDFDGEQTRALWQSALNTRPLIAAADKLLSGDKLASWREIISHPLDNEYWQDVHFTDEQLAQLDLPMFFTDGWYDPTVGPIDFFSRLEKITPNRSDRYLLVGPWNHGQTYAAYTHAEDNGQRRMPESGAMDLVGQRLAFFDSYLKGEATKSQIQKKRVRVFITGSEDSTANRWLDLSTFPAPDTQRIAFYLHSQGDANTNVSDGYLSCKMPENNLSEKEKADTYVYDPERPTPSDTQTPMLDRHAIESRPDVLTYTSEALSTPLTILGDIKLVLHAASDCRDTDWFAQLTEVFPNGESIAFYHAVPAIRARYRKGFDKEVLLIPGEPDVLTILMGAAGHQLAVGNRLRLSICSANFPYNDPNTNTGNNVATDKKIQVARQTIFHDALKPSHLILPIIKWV